ncbi:uncharacterized protein LOC124167894 [Ischnura elegans]|uniref:uncharacterized protein LOC124167894 n=1 Tax=Ischnura elegans TaxID=197161 RepID=UPI001ED88489|nr:uncharacterized protein LOC124167894 [Ischnura elegans]
MTSSKRPRATLLRLGDADTIRFLELYAKERILWDANEDGYRSRDQRAAAAKRIAQALNVPGFGAQEVMIKFKNLRNSYSQELKKIEESEARGFPAEEAYRPKIHWFRTMDSFLHGYIHYRPTHTTQILTKSKNMSKVVESPEESSADIYWEEETQNYEDIELKQEVSDIENDSVPETRVISADRILPAETVNRGVKRKEVPVQEEPDIRSLRRTFTSVASEQNRIPPVIEVPEETADIAAASRLEDAHDQFGKYIASLLRAIGYPEALRLHQEITALVLSRMRPNNN